MIARLISRIDPSALQSTFIRWMQEVMKLSEGEVVAVDGKCLRSSYDRHDRQSAIHMLSAFATANGVVIGQTKTDAKSNDSICWISRVAFLPLTPWAGNIK